MSYKYKNVSQSRQDIIGVGVVAPGQEFITSKQLQNPNFQVVNDAAPQPLEQPEANNTTQEVQI